MLWIFKRKKERKKAFFLVLTMINNLMGFYNPPLFKECESRERSLCDQEKNDKMVNTDGSYKKNEAILMA